MVSPWIQKFSSVTDTESEPQMIDFDKVKVSQDERVKAEKRLAVWADFHKSTITDPPDTSELMALLKVEVTGRKRLYVAQRVLGMYHRVSRGEDATAVAKMLSK
jgi:cobyrinic acid a,c-diamide synthase